MTTPRTEAGRKCINCARDVDAPEHSMWAREADGACHFEDEATVRKRVADLTEWASSPETPTDEWAPVTVHVFRAIRAEAIRQERARLAEAVEAITPVIDAAESAVACGALPVDVLNVTQPMRHFLALLREEDTPNG